mmetsp:Transcript_18260/g.47701  ORF Transcript_18260/g.47701 Transcript_18260/m.47701 type:complete len:333 (+) Transcript_18260:63-1061(+)|eukprot:CAMPEP_0182927066 /NCGR_PEP_ID=MMETSP0105_2-20130417/13085_1 /TAXON_ID=81532 ORGANISM="Acanthoeca-like sp., Strain 10tr" /NCGR_SAMPLE_ID=MMETSP0105_2 /ASSEMBLY_ACC=CAM_ASM_000205 /LENGTH=332 /DNA_ID=CAMNT_0025064993 /DNA_START=57 /DNA_END=1055 /DNA_ORIENTATION=-
MSLFVKTASTFARKMALRQVAARTLSSGPYDIKTVGVVGLGSMGHGVAQLSAASGFQVCVSETSPESLAKGVAAIEKSLTFLAGKRVAKGLLEQEAADVEVAATMSRISGQVGLDQVTAEADLVIEAIVEDLSIKLPFFNELGQRTKPTAILATNTSSYSVAEMAAASGVPERVCGLHYFNPVQVMKLVEVVKTEETNPEVIAAVTDFVKATKKVPVDCSDTPGFIVNRLLVPYMLQAIGMVARGDASAPDVDTGMQLGAGHPMGPITLADYVGLDVVMAIMDGWTSKYPDNPAFQCPEAVALIEEKVTQGHLGRKCGHGFFRWEGNKCLGV